MILNGQEIENRTFSKVSIVITKRAKYVCLQLPLGCSATNMFLFNLFDFKGVFEVEDAYIKAIFTSSRWRWHPNFRNLKAVVWLYFDDIEITEKTNGEYEDCIKFQGDSFLCNFKNIKGKYTDDGAVLGIIDIHADAENGIKRIFDNFPFGRSEVFVNDTSIKNNFQYLRYYFNFCDYGNKGNFLISGREFND